MNFAVAVNIRKARAADAYGGGPKPQDIFIPKEIWVRIATQEAFLAGVRPSQVMGSGRRAEVVLARWKAFRRVLAADQRYTKQALAKVSGYGPYTIARAVKILCNGVDKIPRKNAAKIINGQNDKRTKLIPAAIASCGR